MNDIINIKFAAPPNQVLIPLSVELSGISATKCLTYSDISDISQSKIGCEHSLFLIKQRQLMHNHSI